MTMGTSIPRWEDSGIPTSVPANRITGLLPTANLATLTNLGLRVSGSTLQLLDGSTIVGTANLPSGGSTLSSSTPVDIILNGNPVVGTSIEASPSNHGHRLTLQAGAGISISRNVISATVPQGPRGPAGPQGPQGPAGPPGSASASVNANSINWGTGIDATMVPSRDNFYNIGSSAAHWNRLYVNEIRREKRSQDPLQLITSGAAVEINTRASNNLYGPFRPSVDDRIQLGTPTHRFSHLYVDNITYYGALNSLDAWDDLQLLRDMKRTKRGNVEILDTSHLPELLFNEKGYNMAAMHGFELSSMQKMLEVIDELRGQVAELQKELGGKKK